MKKNIYVLSTMKDEFNMIVLDIIERVDIREAYPEGCIGVVPIYTNKKKAHKAAASLDKSVTVQCLGKAEIV